MRENAYGIHSRAFQGVRFVAAAINIVTDTLSYFHKRLIVRNTGVVILVTHCCSIVLAASKQISDE